MNFLKRAGKSIMARKGKTLILLIILSVIGSLVLSGFAIQHAAKSAGEEARKELGATVTLQVDRQKQMQERQGSGERGRPEQQAISLEEIESIAKLSKVKSVNYVSQTTATSSTVDPVTSEATDTSDSQGPGAMELPEGMTTPDFSLNGVTSMELLATYTAGTLKMVDGEALTAESPENSVVIDENLAAENELNVGDTIKITATTTAQSQKLTIIGLSTSTEATSDAGFRAAGFMDAMNQMYVANDTLAQFATEDGQVSLSSAVYSLNDPASITAFKKEAELAASDLDWDTYVLDANDAAYQKMVGPIEQVASFSKSVVYLVSIAGGLILALLILLSVRERRKEMGILLAMGEKRSKLIGQLLVETFAIAAVAFLITYATGGMTSQFMTDQLLNREVTEAASSVATQTGFGGPGGPGQQLLNSIPQITEMTTKIDWTTLIQVAEIGSLIVLLSVLLPAIALLRMNPKEILLRED